jgi:pyruvate/2-oxoglutarate/acetoin dehydrogenase E1 component
MTSDFQKSVNQAMLMLADEENTVFVGQSVKYDGAAIFHSLKGIHQNKRLEMPVIEDFQLGFCTGLSLTGRLPICIYPRFDFMLLCMNQLINHLDKLPMWGWKPKVIIRTRVGQKKPLDAGPQHTQNYTFPLRQMLSRIEVLEVRNPKHVLEAYSLALGNKHSTIVVENPA